MRVNPLGRLAFTCVMVQGGPIGGVAGVGSFGVRQSASRQ